jgi:hypothetical protein
MLEGIAGPRGPGPRAAPAVPSPSGPVPQPPTGKAGPSAPPPTGPGLGPGPAERGVRHGVVWTVIVPSSIFLVAASIWDLMSSMKPPE